MDISEADWDQTVVGRASQSELLFSQYGETYAKGYSEAVDKYNEILGKISNWKTTDDNSVILTEIEKMIQEMSLEQIELEGLSSSINDWRTSGLINDISAYRSTFGEKANSLNEAFALLLQYVEEVRVIVQAIEDNELRDSSKEVDEILSQVYLLGTDEAVDVKSITIKINALIEHSMNTYNSAEINDIVTFKENLATYEDCISLTRKLDTYIDERLRRTYNIDAFTFQDTKCSEESIEAGMESEGNKESQVAGETEQSIYIISKEAWEEERNSDFYTLITLIKLLPDVETNDDGGDHEKYDGNAVLNDASILQRNLLGQVTDIERAFNYFDSYFPMMACFAAFIAVFFDLGAFFAGCFLYITEFFESK